jgi:hypothetical protein
MKIGEAIDLITEDYGVNGRLRLAYVMQTLSKVKEAENRKLTAASETQEAIDEARLLMESFDDSPAMTVGYEKETYTLSGPQMLLISRALYLADCELSNNE